jgi:membrane protein involved in colicin uptake
MLARLTRENAALIKQRDNLEAAAAEAARAGAAAAAAVAEREQLLQERAATKAQLDAAKADCSKAAASVRQLAAERDRLLQQVGDGSCAGSPTACCRAQLTRGSLQCEEGMGWATSCMSPRGAGAINHSSLAIV